MPPATMRFVRAAWTWFLVGLAMGSALVAAKIGWISPRWLGIRPAHVHVLALGWGVQWVFGIAFWIYPAFGSERTGPRASRIADACWWSLNVGTVVRAVGEAGYDCGVAREAGAVLLAAGALGQVVAGVLFVVLIRGRIRGARWIRRTLEDRAGATASPANAPDTGEGSG